MGPGGRAIEGDESNPVEFRKFGTFCGGMGGRQRQLTGIHQIGEPPPHQEEIFCARYLFWFRAFPEEFTFIGFKRSTGIGSPGVNGAEAAAGFIVLPEKRAKTVAPAQAVPKDIPPSERQFTGRRKIGHPAGDFAAQTALVAVSGCFDAPGILPTCMVQISPIPFPLFYLTEKNDSFAHNPYGIYPTSAGREFFPPRFPLEPVYVAQDEKQRKTRIAEVLQDEGTCCARILLFQIFLKLIRFD
jgi:hypothetical protein